MRPRFARIFAIVTLYLLASGTARSYELTIAHINDHHSSLRPSMEVLSIDGVPTRVEVGGFARLATLFQKAQSASSAFLKLHAGDALVGTPYYAYFGGAADARAMNTICFDAFVPGNHEFDGGDERLRQFLDALREDAACATAVITSNVLPQEGTPLFPRGGEPAFRPSVVRVIGGERVGIVGVTVAAKTRQTSMPLATTLFGDEVIAAQAAINALRNDGVRIIVLLSHVGYEADIRLARQLDGVDVIIGGDSHTLLGEFSRVGLPDAQGPYPTIVKGVSGHPVCIGQAAAYGRVFGRMRIQFDAQGNVLSCDGQASLVIGDEFARADAGQQWVEIEGDEASALRSRLSGIPAVSIAPRDPGYRTRMAMFEERYDQAAAQRIGILPSDQSLCLIRVPGTVNQGGAVCADVVRGARGGAATQIVAEAYRRADKTAEADIGLTNAGGVRAPLETDGVQDLAITSDLVLRMQPFPGELYRLRMSGRDIVRSLEEGVENWLDLGRSDGSHPYASGLRWSLDLSRPSGQRFGNLEVRNPFLQVWEPLDAARDYTVITTAYLARGFENYKTIGALCAAKVAGRCETFDGNMAEQSVEAFIASVAKNPPPDNVLRRPSCAEYSHQQVRTASGVTLAACIDHR